MVTFRQHCDLVLWPFVRLPGLLVSEFLFCSNQPEKVRLICHQESCLILWVVPVVEP